MVASSLPAVERVARNKRRGVWGAAAILAANLAALLVLTPHAPLASAEDYAAIFGQKYAEARQFLEQNGWMETGLELSPQDADIALAVVFPEILRYAVLENEIQVRALKVLYVQYGRRFLNFSVGRFQMKPSFVEKLESDYNRLFSAQEKAAVGIAAFDSADNRERRKERILRLDDPAWQVRYLRLFMLVMDKRYGTIVFADAGERLRFYATAYNFGYAAGETALRRAQAARRFHTELLFPGRTYNYADLSLFYFRQGRGDSAPAAFTPRSLAELGEPKR